MVENIAMILQLPEPQFSYLEYGHNSESIYLVGLNEILLVKC